MAQKYLQGRTFYIVLSPDGGTTKYTLVCLTKQGLGRSRAVNKQDSQCGIAKAYGAVDRTMPLEAVNNLTPAAVVSNVGEASYKLCSTWFEGNTELTMTRKTPSDGSELFQESKCRISKIDDSEDVASNMTFSLELELEGDFDEVA